ncbi:MAG: glycine dehydrogenase, partial [Parvularcula sp.]|nr:glycine dehydrogenase [Parvularcula sp.]
ITKRNKVVMAGGLHPHYAEVVRTNEELIGDTVVQAPASPGAGAVLDMIDDKTSCVIVQSPDVFGFLRDLSAISAKAHEHGALCVAVVTEAVSFGLLRSPGSQGADIVVAEGQSIGNALNFGGPYVGLFASRQKFIRHMPGRLCGETVDTEGRRGFVLTLSTREQHIRRDKATSNICTNSGLCALAFTVHMSLLGGHGLRKVALLSHENAVKTADALQKIEGIELLNDSFFNEFTIRLPKNAAEVAEKLTNQGIIAGVPGGRLWPGREETENLLIIAATELTQQIDIDALVAALKGEI